MKKIPFLTIGNDELKELPAAEDKATCPNCKKKHKIKFGTTNRKINKIAGFVDCGKKSFIVSLGGKLL